MAQRTREEGQHDLVAKLEMPDESEGLEEQETYSVFGCSNGVETVASLGL